MIGMTTHTHTHKHTHTHTHTSTSWAHWASRISSHTSLSSSTAKTTPCHCMWNLHVQGESAGCSQAKFRVQLFHIRILSMLQVTQANCNNAQTKFNEVKTHVDYWYDIVWSVNSQSTTNLSHRAFLSVCIQVSIVCTCMCVCFSSVLLLWGRDKSFIQITGWLLQLLV